MSSSEMQDYIRQYGFGPFDTSDEEHLAEENAFRAEGGHAPTTLEESQAYAKHVEESGRAARDRAAAGMAPDTLGKAERAAAAGAYNNPWSKFYSSQLSQFSPHNNPFNTTNQDQARLEQERVIQDLQRQALGDPNSRSQQQLGQSYGQARAQQSSLGSTMRGQSAGAAMRGIQQGQQGIQRGFAGDQQMLMQQEQQAAQALLAQMLQQQQGQDIGQAGAMAGSQLQDEALNQAMQQFYTQGVIQQGLGDYQYGSDLARTRLGLDLDAQNLQSEQNKQAMQAGGTALSTLMQQGGSGGGFKKVDGQNSIMPDWDK